MMEREMIDMFTNTLFGHYYLACSTSANFDELVMYGECIEMGIKTGRIQVNNSASNTSGNGKKPFVGCPKKKEGDTSAVYPHRGQRQDQSQINAGYIPTVAPQQQQQQQRPQYQQQQQRPQYQQNRFHKPDDMILSP